MKIRKSELKSVIRNILLEKDDWLEDEDIVISPTKKYENLLKKAILKEKQELAGKSQLSNELINKVMKVLDSISLGIDSVDLDSKAYIRHIGFNPDGSVYPESLKNVKTSEKVKNAFQRQPQMNPIVVIVPKVFDKLSNQEQANTLEHEVNHIRNNFIKMVVGLDLNVEEVRDVLRDDFRGKSIVNIVDALTKEGRFKSDQSSIDQASNKRLVSKLKEYYDGVYADPPDELGVDEFAVRFGKLQDYPDVVKDHKGKSYNELLEKYGSEVAQAVLFIDSAATVKEVNRVVKSKSKSVKKKTSAKA
jgi:RNase P protein component